MQSCCYSIELIQHPLYALTAHIIRYPWSFSHWTSVSNKVAARQTKAINYCREKQLKQLSWRQSKERERKSCTNSRRWARDTCRKTKRAWAATRKSKICKWHAAVAYKCMGRSEERSSVHHGQSFKSPSRAFSTGDHWRLFHSSFANSWDIYDMMGPDHLEFYVSGGVLNSVLVIQTQWEENNMGELWPLQPFARAESFSGTRTYCKDFDNIALFKKRLA